MGKTVIVQLLVRHLLHGHLQLALHLTHEQIVD
jgi:hypothetical protein